MIGRRTLIQRGASQGHGTWPVLLLLLAAVLVPTSSVLWFMNAAMRNERLAVRQRLMDVYGEQLQAAQVRLDAQWGRRLRALDEAARLPPALAFSQLVQSRQADGVLVYDEAGRLAYPAVAAPLAPGGPDGPEAWEQARRLEFQEHRFSEAAEAYGRAAEAQEAKKDTDLKAQALQAQARCLVAAGETDNALAILAGTLKGDEFRVARDPAGRLIARDALMYAVQLALAARASDTPSTRAANRGSIDNLEGETPSTRAGKMPATRASTRSSIDNRQSTIDNPEGETPSTRAGKMPATRESTRSSIDSLADRLMDYGLPMPSAQRVFLMRELEAAAGISTPLLAAEELTAALAEAEPPRQQGGTLRPVPRAGLWALAGSDGRVVALLRDAAVGRDLEACLPDPSLMAGAEVVFRQGQMALRRGRWERVSADPQPLLSVAAGRFMPEVGMALYLGAGDPFAAAADRQRTVYLWVGGLWILTIALLAAAVARYVGRQIRLTRLKNDLIATVSHELKTPLASMRVLVDTMREGRCSNAKQAGEYFDLIARENERLSRLIDNFLTFSRMERNKRAFEFAPVDVGEVVRAAAATAGEHFAGPSARLEVDAPPGLPPVLADRDALLTVLLNLLDNAWKYSGPEKLVRLRAFAADSEVRVEVADNGIGMTRRAMRRIFDSFYQVDQTLSRKAGGCGLGLSIVKFILDAHGGGIDVASQPGKGSTFTVRLPSSPARRGDGAGGEGQ